MGVEFWAILGTYSVCRMSRTKNALHVIFYRAVWFFDLLENQTHALSLLVKEIVSRIFHCIFYTGSLEQGSMTLEHMIMDPLWM